MCPGAGHHRFTSLPPPLGKEGGSGPHRPRPAGHVCLSVHPAARPAEGLLGLTLLPVISSPDWGSPGVAAHHPAALGSAETPDAISCRALWPGCVCGGGGGSCTPSPGLVDGGWAPLSRPRRDDATEARPAVTRCSSKANTAPSLVARCDSLGGSTLPARWQGHPMPTPGTGGSAGTPHTHPPRGCSQAGMEPSAARVAEEAAGTCVPRGAQGAEGTSGTGAGRRRAAATKPSAAGARPGPSLGSGR